MATKNNSIDELRKKGIWLVLFVLLIIAVILINSNNHASQQTSRKITDSKTGVSVTFPSCTTMEPNRDMKIPNDYSMGYACYDDTNIAEYSLLVIEGSDVKDVDKDTSYVYIYQYLEGAFSPSEYNIKFKNKTELIGMPAIEYSGNNKQVTNRREERGITVMYPQKHIMVDLFYVSNTVNESQFRSFIDSLKF